MTKDNGQDVIRITTNDLDYFETHGAFPPVVEIEGEQVASLSEDIVVGFKDIVRAEAHDPDRRRDKVTLIPGSQEQYDAGVIGYLKDDIRRLKMAGNAGASIFKELATRYHPDYYSSEDEATKERAGEYTKALLALKKVGVFNG